MGVHGHDSRQWRPIAAIETQASGAHVHRLPARASLDVDLQQVGDAPTSLRRFDFSIDGNECYAHCACAVFSHSESINTRARPHRLARGLRQSTLMQRRCGMVEETRH